MGEGVFLAERLGKLGGVGLLSGKLGEVLLVLLGREGAFTEPF